MISRRLGDTSRLADSLKISLVTGDAQLLEQCGEAVRELAPDCVEIVVVSPHQDPLPRSDLLIWDTDFTDRSRSKQRLAATESRQELFLVSPKHLSEFLTTMPLGAGSTLLKPVNKRTLQIFLEQALLRSRTRMSSFIPDSADVTSQPNDALQALLMANLKLQEYDQDRNNFLARALHDFRAPLMAANGYCSILLQQTLGPLTDNQIDLLQRMHRSLKKLTRMGSAMFELNVGKTVRRGLNLKESSLEACVKAAIQEIDHQAHDKNLSVSVNLSDAQGPLYFDQDQMEQVMVNLLDNACRFTQKGGTIEVRGYPIPYDEVVNNHGREAQGLSSASPKAYRVDVSNTGPGILTEHLESVFEEYTSYSGPEDRSGGGLGLAICKMILTAHRGRIWAANYPGGVKFCFVLPTGNCTPRSGLQRNELTVVAQRAAS